MTSYENYLLSTDGYSKHFRNWDFTIACYVPLLSSLPWRIFLETTLRRLDEIRISIFCLEIGLHVIKISQKNVHMRSDDLGTKLRSTIRIDNWPWFPRLALRSTKIEMTIWWLIDWVGNFLKFLYKNPLTVWFRILDIPQGGWRWQGGVEGINNKFNYPPWN